MNPAAAHNVGESSSLPPASHRRPTTYLRLILMSFQGYAIHSSITEHTLYVAALIVRLTEKIFEIRYDWDSNWCGLDEWRGIVKLEKCLEIAVTSLVDTKSQSIWYCNDSLVATSFLDLWTSQVFDRAKNHLLVWREKEMGCKIGTQGDIWGTMSWRCIITEVKKRRILPINSH